MYRIVFYYDSYEETKQAIQWYSDKSLKTAEKFKTEMRKAISNIISNPFHCQVSLNNNIRAYHLKSFPFSVYYFILQDTIYVLSVFHTSRDLKSLKDKISK